MTRGVVIATEDNVGWDLPLLSVPPSPPTEMPTMMRVVDYVTSTVVIALAGAAVTVLTLVITLVVDCCLPLPPDEDHHLLLVGGEGLHNCRHPAAALARHSRPTAALPPPSPQRLRCAVVATSVLPPTQPPPR